MTRTLSPTPKLGSTLLNLDHLARKVCGRDEALLDERLRQRDDPALVVRHAVVVFGRQRLDVPAPLVDGYAARAHQHGERVHPALPLGVVVLPVLHPAGRQPAHVVMAALNHLPKSGASTASAASATSSARKIHTRIEVRYL